jgi:hypothetical protein
MCMCVFVCVCVPRTSFMLARDLNLKLKTRPKQLLGYLLLSFAFPCVMFERKVGASMYFNPSLPRKNWTRLEKLARDRDCRLFSRDISDKVNKVLKTQKNRLRAAVQRRYQGPRQGVQALLPGRG